jgi:hypothetical protein
METSGGAAVRDNQSLQRTGNTRGQIQVRSEYLTTSPYLLRYVP